MAALRALGARACCTQRLLAHVILSPRRASPGACGSGKGLARRACCAWHMLAHKNEQAYVACASPVCEL